MELIRRTALINGRPVHYRRRRELDRSKARGFQSFEIEGLQSVRQRGIEMYARRHRGAGSKKNFGRGSVGALVEMFLPIAVCKIDDKKCGPSFRRKDSANDYGRSSSGRAVKTVFFGRQWRIELRSALGKADRSQAMRGVPGLCVKDVKRPIQARWKMRCTIFDTGKSS